MVHQPMKDGAGLGALRGSTSLALTSDSGGQSSLHRISTRLEIRYTVAVNKKLTFRFRTTIVPT